MKREGLSKNLVNSNWWKVYKPFFYFMQLSWLSGLSI